MNKKLFLIIPSLLLLCLPEVGAAKDEKAYLGVVLHKVPSELRTELNLKVYEGAIIDKVVENSPADDGGLVEGDIIMTFKGEKVRGVNHLSRLVRKSSPDEKVEMEIVRDGKKKKIKIKLGKREKSEVEISIPKIKIEEYEKKIRLPKIEICIPKRVWLGVNVHPLNEELAKYFGVKKGVLILEVEDDSPAEHAKMKPGDVIIEIDGEKIKDRDDIIEVLDDKEEGDSVKIKVVREKKEKKFEVKLEQSPSYKHWKWRPMDFIRPFSRV